MIYTTYQDGEGYVELGGTCIQVSQGDYIMTFVPEELDYKKLEDNKVPLISTGYGREVFMVCPEWFKKNLK